MIDDDSKSRWSIHPRVGESHAAILVLNVPLSIEDGSELKITLSHGDQDHNLGKFRISACSDDIPSLPIEYRPVTATSTYTVPPTNTGGLLFLVGGSPDSPPQAVRRQINPICVGVVRASQLELPLDGLASSALSVAAYSKTGNLNRGRNCEEPREASCVCLAALEVHPNSYDSQTERRGVVAAAVFETNQPRHSFYFHTKFVHTDIVKNITISVGDELWKRLRDSAASEHVSMNAFIRDTLSRTVRRTQESAAARIVAIAEEYGRRQRLGSGIAKRFMRKSFEAGSHAGGHKHSGIFVFPR